MDPLEGSQPRVRRETDFGAESNPHLHEQDADYVRLPTI